MRLLIAFLVVSLFTIRSFAGEDVIPKQMHPIEDCRASSDDKACVKSAWDEYRNAIVAEYDQWNELLPVAESGDADAANRAFAIPRQNGWYVHNHWMPIIPGGDESEVIPFDAAEAVFACARPKAI